jgi:ketosteroid isomerase-like protein
MTTTPKPVSAFPIFHVLFESGRNNDFEAMADTMADDCEWVLMPNMQSFKGKAACVELCTKGKLSSDKTPEILLDVATPEWGVFEYMNRGTITKDLTALAAIDSDFKLAEDPATLAGRQYAVAVCFVYRINADGKIYLVHEYLDMASLMKQLK